jgi:hypothetical protein
MPPPSKLGHNAAVALISRGKHAQNDYVARHRRLRRRPLADGLGAWGHSLYPVYAGELGATRSGRLDASARASDQRLRATSGARGAQPLLPFGGSLGIGIPVRDCWRIPGLRPRPERSGIPFGCSVVSSGAVQFAAVPVAHHRQYERPLRKHGLRSATLARMAGRVGRRWRARSYQRIEWIRRLASGSRAVGRFLRWPSESRLAPEVAWCSPSYQCSAPEGDYGEVEWRQTYSAAICRHTPARWARPSQQCS